MFGHSLVANRPFGRVRGFGKQAFVPALLLVVNELNDLLHRGVQIVIDDKLVVCLALLQRGRSRPWLERIDAG